MRGWHNFLDQSKSDVKQNHLKQSWITFNTPFKSSTYEKKKPINILLAWEAVVMPRMHRLTHVHQMLSFRNVSTIDHRNSFSVFKYIIISISSKYMWAQKKNRNRVDEQTINNSLYTYWHLRHTYRPVSGENNFFSLYK